jgi:hypothetical protein
MVCSVPAGEIKFLVHTLASLPPYSFCPSGKETYLNAYNSLLSTAIIEDSSLEVNSLAVSAELFLSCFLKTYKDNWTENY